MTITAQTGVLSFGPQAAKGTLASTWHRHKALNVALGAVTEKDVAPPEVGGINNPTGAFKTGAYFAGRVSLIPRLEDVFGWVLLGATGQVATVAAAAPALAQHTFTQASDANGGAAFLPWYSFRRMIPGSNGALNDLGEIGLDCKMTSVAFRLPQAGPVVCDIDVQGRVPTLDAAPDTWTYSAVYEDFSSVPMSMAGEFVLISDEFEPVDPFERALPITSATITLMNNLTSIREERIIGSYFPDDFATRQRIMQIEIIYKWSDPDLARFIFNNGIQVPQSDFDPCLTYTGFRAVVESPCEVDDTFTNPYRMTFEAPKVDWRPAGPVELAGDEIVQQRYVGIAIEADTALPEDYYTITLENNAAGYVLP